MTSRREFVERAAMSAIALSLPEATPSWQPSAAGAPPPPRGFLDIARPPDRVVVQTADGANQLQYDGDQRWKGEDGVVVTTTGRDGALHVSLAAPAVAIHRLQLRWRGSLRETRLILGDAWERGYGDLEWRGWVPDRVMPWYVATSDGARTHAYGVRTGARAFCSWQVDPRGITLWADVRSGATGVRLGERTLEVCAVLCRTGHADESAFAALHAFCRQMCRNPRLPSQPVYGSNDWYWTYGKNSADSVRTDAAHIVELSPAGDNRPFAVIDDGWQPERGAAEAGVGIWDRGNEKFPDMPGLVTDIRRAGARAGIWIRPLQATEATPDGWRLRRDRRVLDPSLPEVREKVTSDMARLRQWGFELIKHDYTTFDLFGRWGFQMGAAMTQDGWSFASGQTTAEVIDDLYAAIRSGAGESLVIGCNTVSHLSAGHVEMCRIGDDTSGTEWARTRKMGVNSLAFRGPQHGAFYVADADCVGVTKAVPWALNRQWLDLLAGSGTMLFASLEPAALGAAERRDLRAALAIAATPQPLAEPLDWQRTVYPEHWRVMGSERTFEWVGADGAGPL